MNKTSTISIIGLIIAVVALGFAFFPRTSPTPKPGNGYGDLGFASFANSTAVSTSTTVGVGTSTVVIPANGRLTEWKVCNISTNAAWLSYASPAATSTGILLNPQASSTQTCETEAYPSLFVGNLYGIANASSALSVSWGLGN